MASRGRYGKHVQARLTRYSSSIGNNIREIELPAPLVTISSMPSSLSPLIQPTQEPSSPATAPESSPKSKRPRTPPGSRSPTPIVISADVDSDTDTELDKPRSDGETSKKRHTVVNEVIIEEQETSPNPKRQTIADDFDIDGYINGFASNPFVKLETKYDMTSQAVRNLINHLHFVYYRLLAFSTDNVCDMRDIFYLNNVGQKIVHTTTVFQSTNPNGQAWLQNDKAVINALMLRFSTDEYQASFKNEILDAIKHDYKEVKRIYKDVFKCSIKPQIVIDTKILVTRLMIFFE